MVSNIGSYLEERRRELILSVHDVAKAVHVSDDEWGEIESGKEQFSVKYIKDVCNVLALREDLLVFDLYPDLIPFLNVHEGEDIVEVCCEHLRLLSQFYHCSVDSIICYDKRPAADDNLPGSRITGDGMKWWRNQAYVSKICAGMMAGCPATVIDNYESGVYDHVLQYIMWNTYWSGQSMDDYVAYGYLYDDRGAYVKCMHDAYKVVAWLWDNILEDYGKEDKDKTVINDTLCNIMKRTDSDSIFSGHQIWTDDKVKVVRDYLSSVESYLPCNADRFFNGFYAAWACHMI